MDTTCDPQHVRIVPVNPHKTGWIRALKFPRKIPPLSTDGGNKTMQGNIPSPPTEPPDEAALSYFAIVGDSIASQIAEARINGLKVPAYLLLPPPPRPCDL
jgi:hypothetical protein